ncbi:hypothetical protein BSKO_11259 [Bryopsis sp. KO-2023]|nr:hypothetical protein BSKO_11259 [Bryopsis sp. KO-2023]
MDGHHPPAHMKASKTTTATLALIVSRSVCCAFSKKRVVVVYWEVVVLFIAESWAGFKWREWGLCRLNSLRHIRLGTISRTKREAQDEVVLSIAQEQNKEGSLGGSVAPISTLLCACGFKVSQHHWYSHRQLMIGYLVLCVTAVVYHIVIHGFLLKEMNFFDIETSVLILFFVVLVASLLAILSSSLYFSSTSRALSIANSIRHLTMASAVLCGVSLVYSLLAAMFFGKVDFLDLGVFTLAPLVIVFYSGIVFQRISKVCLSSAAPLLDDDHIGNS